jgi:hypothetical protein
MTMAKYDTSAYNRVITSLAKDKEKDLDALMAKRSEFSDLKSYRSFLRESIPALSTKYENAASALAAESYKGWRKDVLGKPYDAQTYDFYDGTTKASARSLTHKIKEAAEGNMSDEQAIEETRRQLSAMLDRRMYSAARDTMMNNSRADKDGTGCASIPTSRKPCAFCLEMAAVGVAYSFKVMKIQGMRFHDHCHCIFLPGFIGHSVEVEGFSSDAVRNALDDAKRTLGIPVNAFAAGKNYRPVTDELARRDPRWVMEGIVPEVTADDDELMLKIEKDRPHELMTAKRLTQHGYPFNFQHDYRHYFDAELGLNQTVGLADDSYGKELKWVSPDARSASSVVTNAYSSAIKKEGVSLLVIDNADSGINDVDIIREVRNRIGKLSYPTLVIEKDGAVTLIR